MFNAEELIGIAIRIEENGYRFYRLAADQAGDSEARLLFNHLADEESGHREIFTALLPEAEKTQRIIEGYPGEHQAYIKAYADNIIFGNELKEDEIPVRPTGLDAMNFAIQREQESILYYQEIKKYFPESRRELLDRIIDEEKQHFVKVTNLRKSSL